MMTSAFFMRMGRKLGSGGILSPGVLTSGQSLYFWVSLENGGL